MGAAAVLVVASTVTILGTAHAADAEHVANGTFDVDTTGWFGYNNVGTAPALRVQGGQLCTDVPAGGVNAFDMGDGTGPPNSFPVRPTGLAFPPTPTPPRPTVAWGQ